MNPHHFTLIALIVFIIFVVFIVTLIVSLLAQVGRDSPNLRRIERKLDALLQHQGVVLPSKLSPEVQRLASEPRQKIAAIKLHREQTGVSLAQAKAEVEDFGG